MMEDQGYDRDFSTCLTMASSVEGILVPPSQNMVIYTLAAAGVTSVSIGQLFLAGYVITSMLTASVAAQYTVAGAGFVLGIVFAIFYDRWLRARGGLSFNIVRLF